VWKIGTVNDIPYFSANEELIAAAVSYHTSIRETLSKNYDHNAPHFELKDAANLDAVENGQYLTPNRAKLSSRQESISEELSKVEQELGALEEELKSSIA
jgi:hypothetical protein